MEWRRTFEKTREKPFIFAQRRVANGSSEKSFVTDSLRNRDDIISPMDDDFILKWASVSILQRHHASFHVLPSSLRLSLDNPQH